MKLLLGSLCAALFLCFLHADGFLLPNQFSLESRKLGNILQFHLKSEGDSIGVIHRKAFCKTYEFVDSFHDLQSVAAYAPESLPTFKVIVTDAEGGKIGTIEELAYCFLPAFYFLSPDGTILATLETNFWNTEILVHDTLSGDTIAKLFRPAFREVPDWSCEILIADYFTPSHIDSRLLISFLAIMSDN